MITGAQIRAGRALIGWSAAMLAREAGLSYPTVQRAESADGIPSSTAANLFAMQSALERGGVIFLTGDDGGGDGVRLRKYGTAYQQPSEKGV